MKMKYSIFGILCLMIVSTAAAQQTEVKGVVADSVTGERLPYAAVILKGTDIGGATDDDGRFAFSVPNAPEKSDPK